VARAFTGGGGELPSITTSRPEVILPTCEKSPEPELPAVANTTGVIEAESFITATEAKAFTGMSLSALSKLCREGGPVRFRRPAGRRLEIHAADLARYLTEREAAEN